jgi:DNA-directed RNA polymerase specialized sigma24 family protein
MPSTRLVEEAYAIAQPLARGKAIHLSALHRLRGFEREDVEAELLLNVCERLHKFDHRRGALRTFLSKCMDNHAMSILRRAHAQPRLANLNCSSLCSTAVDRDGTVAGIDAGIMDPEPDLTALRRSDLAIDVRRLLERLPRGTREAAIALSEASPSKAARRLGKSRTWIYKQIAHLREAFLAEGLVPPLSGADKTIVFRRLV